MNHMISLQGCCICGGRCKAIGSLEIFWLIFLCNACNASSTNLRPSGTEIPKFAETINIYNCCLPQLKVIWDVNPDFGVNPDSDLDVCQITYKMLWFHYLVSIFHFAKCHENQLVTVWEMLTNLLKFPILQQWWKWKSDAESISRTASPPKVNQFFRLAGPIKTLSLNEIG